jgi:NodT family efflux transporter outer membrane factor (OMF) lipoprotein
LIGRAWIATVLCGGLIGCATPPEREPLSDALPLSVPQQWQAESQALPGEPRAWLADFDSPVLDRLIAEALGGNFDLRAALARVDAARSRADIAGADLWPQVELGVDASRRKSVIETGDGTTDVTRNRYNLDGSVTWEPDVWGRLRNRSRAAALDALASEADYRAARLSLAAGVARAWFETIEAEQQLSLARTVVEYFRDSQEVTEGRYRRGIGTALDVRLGRQNVASAESNLALRQRQRDTAVRSLEILLGRYPVAGLAIPEELPQIVREIPVGLPSTLLERRPDLIAARQRLLAAGERLSEANKNRLPSFRLTATGGFTSEEFARLLDYDALVWSLIAGVTQPIFEGGRLSAERALAAAEDREVWAQYAQTVLEAFREVESTLAAEAYLVDEEAALTRASEEAREAAFLALDEYRRGLTDIVTLLESQRRAVNSEISRLQVARLRLENRVNLYLALGGPFDAEDAAAIEVSRR